MTAIWIIGTFVARTDTSTWDVDPSADILLTRYWSFGGYYLRRQNSDSVSTVDFYSNEVRVRTTIKF